MPFFAVFLVMILGTYFGTFTPAEGASVGAFATLLYALAKGISGAELWRSVQETLVRSAVVLCILLLYFVLGMFMDAIAMLVITMPAVLPIIQSPYGAGRDLQRRRALHRLGLPAPGTADPPPGALDHVFDLTLSGAAHGRGRFFITIWLCRVRETSIGRSVGVAHPEAINA